jgi:prolipoprotein diacylglyceryl transferase
MNSLLYITWTVSPEIFVIGPITIKWYSLLFAVTFLVGYIILQKIFCNEGKPKSDLDSLAVYVMVGTILGARLGHCLFYDPDYYLSHPVEILQVWKGGLASHGGVIGILIAIWAFSKKTGYYSFLWVVDRVVIVAALAGLFIRTGNFFNSEIIGKPTDLPWAVIFTSVDDLPRHPSMLYEALVDSGIFVFLYCKYVRDNFFPKPGMLFGLFLSSVFTARFLLEFTKEIQSPFEANLLLNMGQILSLPCIFTGFILIFLSHKGTFIQQTFTKRKNKK